MSAEAHIKQAAKSAGFELCGIASLASPPAHLDALVPWLAAGRHGSMTWMERQAEKRLDPSKIMPGARNLICVGLVYNTDHPYSTDTFPIDGRVQKRPAGSERQVWISRYAWGEDYHRVMERKLAALKARLLELHPGATFRAYADTGPISEKTWAAWAGLGWQGKHTNIINQELGSWFFLGELLTDLDLQADPPARDLCGSCTRCLDACPTQAFTQAYELDANRCLSYLSIELKGAVPEEFHSAFGANAYGCDICQDVCPWNRARVLGHENAFEPAPGLVSPRLDELEALDETGFAERFRHSAIRRTKAAGLRRNLKLTQPTLDKP
jgi:epoxyqueuosine reductase